MNQNKRNSKAVLLTLLIACMVALCLTLPLHSANATVIGCAFPPPGCWYYLYGPCHNDPCAGMAGGAGCCQLICQETSQLLCNG